MPINQNQRILKRHPNRIGLLRYVSSESEWKAFPELVVELIAVRRCKGIFVHCEKNLYYVQQLRVRRHVASQKLGLIGVNEGLQPIDVDSRFVHALENAELIWGMGWLPRVASTGCPRRLKCSSYHAFYMVFFSVAHSLCR